MRQLEAEFRFEGDQELKRIQRIEAESFRPENRRIIRERVRAVLQQQLRHHQFLGLLL